MNRYDIVLGKRPKKNKKSQNKKTKNNLDKALDELDDDEVFFRSLIANNSKALSYYVEGRFVGY